MLEAPRVTHSALEIVKSYCNDEVLVMWLKTNKSSIVGLAQHAYEFMKFGK